MINERNEPIVMDFGLARKFEKTADTRLTQEGMLVGTPTYMSPEQVECDDERIGPQSDIYALGIVFYEMLTGQVPFSGSVAKVIAQIVRDDPPAPSALRTSVSPKADEICMQMIQKSQVDRFSSMSEVAEALAGYLRNTTESVVSPKPNESPISPATKLKQQADQIRKQMNGGDWLTAEKALQAMAADTDPVAANYVTWAHEQLVTVRQQIEQRRTAANAIVHKAQSMLDQHEYADAAGLLVKIETPFQTQQTKVLLEESVEKQTQVDHLFAQIERGLRTGQSSKTMQQLQRLMQLKPNDPVVEYLFRKYRWQSRFGGLGGKFADAFAPTTATVTRSNYEEPFLRKYLALSGFIFLLLCALTAASVTIYIKQSGKHGKVAINVTDEALADGDVEITVGRASTAEETRPADASSSDQHAIHFSGSSRVEVPSLVYDGRTPITLEAWVRLTNPPSGRGIVMSFAKINDSVGESGIQLAVRPLEDDAHWFFGASSGDWEKPVQSKQAAAVGKWTHLAATLEGKTIRLFVDGELVDERDLWKKFVPSKMHLVLGASPVEGPGMYYHGLVGSMKEVRVSKSIRYRASFQPTLRLETDSETLALFHCDDGKGTKLLDSSGNGHDGTIVDAEWESKKVSDTDTFSDAGKKPTAEQILQRLQGHWRADSETHKGGESEFKGKQLWVNRDQFRISYPGLQDPSYINDERGRIEINADVEPIEIDLHYSVGSRDLIYRGIIDLDGDVLKHRFVKSNMRDASRPTTFEGSVTRGWENVYRRVPGQSSEEVDAKSGVHFPSDGKFVNARPLKTLNQAANVNAYPCISADGGTIWWTREGQDYDAGGIYQAARDSRSGEFSNIIRVSDGRLASVSPNGLEITCLYDADGDYRYRELGSSRRDNLNTIFPKPQVVPALAELANPKGSAYSSDGLALLVFTSSDIFRLSRGAVNQSWEPASKISIPRSGQIKTWTWPSMANSGNLLVLGAKHGDGSTEEWPYVVERNSEGSWGGITPILIDGQHRPVRAPRYCAATGELYYTVGTGPANAPHQTTELWVANAGK